MIFKWLLRDCMAIARRRSDSCMAGSMDDAYYAQLAAVHEDFKLLKSPSRTPGMTRKNPVSTLVLF